MRLSQITLLLAAAGVGNCSPAKRQGPNEPLVVLSPGSITAPANGTRVEAGHSFTLGIADPVPEWSHCHPGYTPVDLYLVADKPTVSSLNSTQQFSSYLHYYGEYLVNNLPGSLPPMGTPPPSTLTVPKLQSSYNGKEIYLAAVETIFDCPPNGFTEWALDSTGIIYHA